MKWLVACAAAVLTACGPGPASSPVDHADRAGGAEAPTRFGHEDGSAATVVDPKTSGPVTLTQLLAFAEVNAPALIVASQRTKLGDAEVEGAQTLVPYNPQVNVTAGGRTSGGVTRFEFGAGVQQQFEIGGERATRIEAAERSRDARIASIAVSRWEVHAQVLGLYYELLVRNRQLIAADRVASFTKSLRAIIDKRVEAGEESPLETIVARAELAKASQSVIAARQAHRATALRLAEIAGWPAQLPLKVTGTLAPPAPVANREALVQRAVEAHPSKHWLELEVRASRARIEREDRRAWPDPTLGVNYGREGEAGGAAHVWTGTLTVPVPIWARNQAGRARARAQLEVARAKRQAFERALRVQIVAAMSRVDAAAERVRLYGADILPAFDSNLSKLQRAFELGEIDVLELAQIQRRILVTQQDALTALADYYRALAVLEALSGVDSPTIGADKP